MNLEQLLGEILKIFFLPPGINIITIIAGIILFRNYKKTAYSIFGLSLVSLFFLSLPSVSSGLMASVETTTPLSTQQIKDLSKQSPENRAIVVLSAGRVAAAPEYDKIDIVNPDTLQRIHYASWLQKRTGLAVLLSGGSDSNAATAEAVLMNQLMVSSFGNQPRWIESESKDTGQSAEFSANILKKDEIDEIVLVTHAWHMPKAKRAFEKQGIKVIEAPTAFQNNQLISNSWRDYFPNSRALEQSNQAIFEKLVTLWIAIRY